jgi:hypothetical protein
MRNVVYSEHNAQVRIRAPQAVACVQQQQRHQARHPVIRYKHNGGLFALTAGGQ